MTPRQLVESWVAAFNRADPDALATLYAEDAVNHQVMESPFAGRDAIRRMIAAGFQVADGQIRFQRGYWDKLSFLRMHGLPRPQT